MEKEIIKWIYEAAELIKSKIGDHLQVDHKTGRTDLVTNVDKEVQEFLVAKIKRFDPHALILGEENGQDTTPIDHGRVFVIDPIDGTLNFVYQRENFCIMIAVYEEGVGQLGFIYDVMAGDLYWGGPKIGKVFCNDQELAPVKDQGLADGLIGMGIGLYAHSTELQKIGERSMGVRVLGCAGLEMIAMLKGQQLAYISLLSPWDYAPGKIMIEQLGMVTSGANQQPLKFSGRELFFGATKQVMAQINADK